jgi:hypothetical protein
MYMRTSITEYVTAVLLSSAIYVLAKEMSSATPGPHYPCARTNTGSLGLVPCTEPQG